ncbi:DUF551 domain-containing protein [Klebsiella pneumoniae]|nr:DUF551 domain-containing protein [Klebsiella pneumoniae]HBR3825409.1 DUF551 domain-containing protein [Klebsiella pneumoniae]
MTKSTITRERLEWLSQISCRDDIEDIGGDEIRELASMALAAMDSEPLAVTDDELNAALQLHRLKVDGHSQLSDAFRAGFRYARRTTPQPAPVVSAELLHTAASAVEDLLTTKDRTGACVWFDLPFRLRSAANAQPAQVVPAVSDDIGEIRVGRLPTMNQDDYPGLGDWWVQLRIGEDSDEVLARVNGATPQEANNRAEALACRAAMLQELKKSAGTEAICRSDENVQVLHTKSPAQSDCCPAQNHVSPEQNGDTPAQSQGWIQVSEQMPEAEGHYLVWTNASRIDGYCDHLAIATYQGGGWSNEFNWLVTHWMPLPAGPQEVNYG